MALSTGNISLQDVVTEISPASNTLNGCVVAANTFGFDSAYQGAMNSLYNFKGYDHSLTELLSISPTAYSIGSVGGTFDITITSNTSWTLNTDSPSFLSYDQASGSMNDTITVTVTPNGGASSRSGRVSFNGEGGTSVNCLITQDGTS